MPLDQNTVRLLGVAAAIVIALFGMWIVHARLKEQNQGFGPNSTRALAIVIFVPTILAVASAVALSSEAIAALMGTLAGYIFSKTGEDPK